MHDISRGLKVVPLLAGIAAVFATSSLEARIVKITIESTTPIQNGQSFGKVGPYERLRGTAFGEIDPADRHNAGITDIQFAAKNANGKVEYKTQFSIDKPVDVSKASGILQYVVPNRGGIAVAYNRGTDGFVYNLGEIVLNSAWQGDQPIASQPATALGIDVPIATGVTGPVWARFVAVAQTAGANTTTASLPGLGRTPASLDTTKASLITATAETPTGVKSGVATIPASDFAFADCRTVAFPGTADATRLCVKGGFNPALLYELVYTAKDPFILGVGNAAMRDVISFFRYQTKDDAGTANPIAGKATTVIGFGNSQSGRFMKHMINNGFNEDENGKMVWDGVNPNIAGMMGSFNIRFAQPGDIAELYDPGADGPLWWSEYNDTVRGHGTWSLLTRCTATNTCPKVMETYGGPEAWYSRGTVGMAGTAGTADVPLTQNVRRYYHPGTTHGGGSGGFNLGTQSTNPDTLAANPNPQSDTNRALHIALVNWVTKGTPPPDSMYPKISDGTLVAATSAAMGWPNIPKTPKPDGVMNSVLDYDYGPLFRYNDGSGVISNVPPPIKRVIPTLAPKVDIDGNEIAGVKSLLFSLPLGTYTGWNPIGSGPLKGREASLSAGYIPFPKTKAERIAANDPRLSIEERYGNLYTYYFLAIAKANDIAARGFLLPDDANLLINQLLNNIYANGILPKIGSVPKEAAVGEEAELDAVEQ